MKYQNSTGTTTSWRFVLNATCWSLLHCDRREISAVDLSFYQPSPFRPAHSPSKHCCGREGRRRDELIYYSDLSVSEEGQQGGSAAEKDKAVLTNEGISQWYDLPHASFIQSPAEVHKQGWCTVACLSINGVCKEARRGRTLFYKSMATWLLMCPNKLLKSAFFNTSELKQRNKY